jgi:hypothetical protein
MLDHSEQRRTVRDAESPKPSLARRVTDMQRPPKPLSEIRRVTLRRFPNASVLVRVTLTELPPPKNWAEAGAANVSEIARAAARAARVPLSLIAAFLAQRAQCSAGRGSSLCSETECRSLRARGIVGIVRPRGRAKDQVQQRAFRDASRRAAGTVGVPNQNNEPAAFPRVRRQWSPDKIASIERRRRTAQDVVRDGSACSCARSAGAKVSRPSQTSYDLVP